MFGRYVGSPDGWSRRKAVVPDRVRAVGLEDAHRPGGADPVAVQEDHDLPDDFLLGPGVRDPFGSNRANAGHLAKPIGLGLDRKSVV